MSVNTSELRRENYLNRKYFNPDPKNPNWQTEVCVVSMIQENFINVKIKGNRKLKFKSTSDIISPIPLTEEWLLRAGFKKHKKNHSYTKGVIRICLCYDNKWRFVRHIFTNLEDEPCIDYVHQLQNLYFVLYEKELIFKM